MQISNPIATQYVTNQGLASQLNTQDKQLPVKSERFALDNKIPAPTEDEQRLRSEADKKNKQTAGLEINQENFPAVNGSARNLANNSASPQQQATEQYIAELSDDKEPKQKEPVSAPIKSYLETSALSSGTPQLSRIDFFI